MGYLPPRSTRPHPFRGEFHPASPQRPPTTHRPWSNQIALSSKSRWRWPDLELSTLGRRRPAPNRHKGPVSRPQSSPWCNFAAYHGSALPRERNPKSFFSPSGGRGTDHEWKRGRITLCDGYHPKYRSPWAPCATQLVVRAGQGYFADTDTVPSDLGRRFNFILLVSAMLPLSRGSPGFKKVDTSVGHASGPRGSRGPPAWLGSERQHPVILEVWEGPTGIFCT